MIGKEIKLLIRKIYNNRTYSFINIAGLSIGLICTIIAFMYVQDQLKYDQYFSNKDNIFRLTINNNRAETFHTGQPTIFFDKIIQNVPEIKSGSRLMNNEVIIQAGENTYNENRFLFADSNFFSFYGWHLLSGDPEEVLNAPLSVVISRSKAKELFNNEDPTGKTILVNNNQTFTIKGVFEDLPEQSHFTANYLVSFKTLKQLNPWSYTSWGWHGTSLYFKLYNKESIETANKKIAALWNKESKDYSCVGDFVQSKLQPYTNIYLKSGYLYSSADNIVYVLGFAIISLLILFIGCFNFINLYLAVNTKVSQETGIKKVLGAGKKVFTRQVLSEISIYLFTSLIISFVAIYYLIPHINNLLNLHLVFSLKNNLSLGIFIIILCSLILFITSIFPVTQLLYTKTANVLKGMYVTSEKRRISLGNIRNGLVIAQFTIGIMLILATIIINKQLRLIRQHDLGYNKEQVITISNSIGDGDSRYSILKNALSNYPEIQSITTGKNTPAQGMNNWGGASVAGNEENKASYCGYISVNDNYFKTIGARIIKGRDFYTNESDNDKVIINRAMAKQLNLKNPIGKLLTGLWYSRNFEIVGVVDDIEYYTLHLQKIPAVFFIKASSMGIIWNI